jgi:hypothetical protein
MFQKFLSRKLFVTAYAFILGPTLLWFGKLDGPSFVAWMLGAGAAYVVSQGLVDHAEARQ